MHSSKSIKVHTHYSSLLTMVLLESKNLPLGSDIIPFTLPHFENNLISNADFSEAQALVVIFMCNHCPYVQAIIQRLIKLQKMFLKTQFIGINSNDWQNYPEDSPKKMKEYSQQWEMNFPYLYDESQEVAKDYQAQCTPDIYVFDENRKLVYHGRVDDNWKNPQAVKHQELKSALEAILRGEKINTKQNPSIGCSIKWKE